VEDLFNPSDIDDYNDLETEQPSKSQEIESFDISDIENLEFDIPETDAQISANSDNFETGNEDDFSFENQEFEIPGFSDVETSSDVVAPQPKPNANVDEVDFSGGLEGDNLPPNTLSDEQYKQFLKNFSTYPLNVRLAFENFIVQDEFTDDAEFEVIEKILNKAPARQVAALLEKMLDTSIPVPRDYEQRSAEEYEAYKKSVQYQLRNKIIPGTLIFMLMVLIGWGLFNFTKHCIYIPAKANSLYKQGYALIEQNEFPQSKVKFDSAVRYRLSKNWFFKYARAYREKKQYQRSAQMYTNILRCFNNDKTAGLEYAQMELDDLANYERAEEILRREVLDYHVNDPDGILMLGDVFIEWGTEKDASKFDLAQEQYSSLLQLYKPNNLYHSRMMRYYIRTDNLAYVLAYKNLFEPKEKSLAPEDWTELSGYLLEKMYEPLTPSEEPLRYKIEGLRGLLQRAVTTDSENPVATYNLAKYFVLTSENLYIESALRDAIEKFDNAKTLKRRDIYKYIDSYRLLGEFYVKSQDYLKAQEQFTQGISLYTVERDNAGFKGNAEIGNMYADLADINFEHSGDYIQAKENYKNAINLGYDNSSIRYRIGYIQYQQKNYLEALGSFMKSGEGNLKERNLLLAMANTLYLRGDDYAAEGYYAQLIDSLDKEIADQGIVFPQASEADYDIVNTYLYAANNYGVTLARLAKRTGDSSKNAHAIVQFQQSVRAWDALTRNQQTLVRLDGSNLALENIKYVSRPISTFEPSIYVEIPKTLKDKE
jgi:tetratricopeptide (TPR) repeat protein